MKLKVKILIIILGLSFVLGGFFYFIKSYPKETVVYETKAVSNNNEERTSPDESKNDEIQEVEVIDNISKEEVKIKDEPIAQIPKEIEEKSKLDIESHLVSWGFSKSDKRKIDTIILHSSYNAIGGEKYDFNKIVDEYKDYGVAPHYVIDRKGVIYRLVADNNVAYHAGKSSVPDGRDGVNDFSLGIEIFNTQEDEFTKAQYESTNQLIKFLKDKYPIKYVLGHDQIAPGRKTDPWNINWSKINK